MTTEDGLRLVPEIYSVPADKVEAEYKEPGSQQREVAGKLPFKWAQSLYVVGRLLQDVRITHLLPVSLPTFCLSVMYLFDLFTIYAHGEVEILNYFFKAKFRGQLL